MTVVADITRPPKMSLWFDDYVNAKITVIGKSTATWIYESNAGIHPMILQPFLEQRFTLCHLNAIENGVHAMFKDFGGNGLGNVILSAGFEQQHCFVNGGMCGHDQHRKLRGRGSFFLA